MWAVLVPGGGRMWWGQFFWNTRAHALTRLASKLAELGVELLFWFLVVRSFQTQRPKLASPIRGQTHRPSFASSWEVSIWTCSPPLRSSQGDPLCSPLGGPPGPKQADRFPEVSVANLALPTARPPLEPRGKLRLTHRKVHEQPFNCLLGSCPLPLPAPGVSSVVPPSTPHL